MTILITILLFFMFVNGAVYACGESCLSRSLTEATTSDTALTKNIGLSLQYEYLNMKTIRDSSNSVSPGLELNGLYAREGDDHDGMHSKPNISLLDNTDNTGVTSLPVTPAARVNVAGAGCSVDLKSPKTLYQHADGTQLVVDRRAFVSGVRTF